MIVAYSYVTVRTPEARAEFEDAMRSRSGLVEGFPGFIRFEFRQQTGRDRRFVIATWWDSMKDLRNYMSSEAHRQTHGRLSARTKAAIDPPRVEIHEVLEFQETGQ